MAHLDEDDFWSGKQSPSAALGRPVQGRLAPLGERIRPNGSVYKPRQIGPHEDLALLNAARDAGQHVLLYGPPGCGKTASIEAAFAEPAGPGLYTLLGTSDTTVEDFVGTYVPDPRDRRAFPWLPGPLTLSVMTGVPLLIDEIALIDPRTLSVLYEVMDGRGVLRIPSKPDLAPIPVKDGWFVAATYNPDVPGAQLSDALRDRFTHHFEVGTDWELARELGVPEDLVNIAEHLDTRRRNKEFTWTPQLRTLLDARDLAATYDKLYAVNNMLAKAPAHDRDLLLQVMKTTFPKAAVACVGGRYGA
jgi:nitric oxide reductase NorQ protein